MWALSSAVKALRSALLEVLSGNAVTLANTPP